MVEPDKLVLEKVGEQTGGDEASIKTSISPSIPTSSQTSAPTHRLSIMGTPFQTNAFQTQKNQSSKQHQVPGTSSMNRKYDYTPTTEDDGINISQTRALRREQDSRDVSGPKYVSQLNDADSHRYIKDDFVMDLAGDRLLFPERLNTPRESILAHANFGIQSLALQVMYLA